MSLATGEWLVEHEAARGAPRLTCEEGRPQPQRAERDGMLVVLDGMLQGGGGAAEVLERLRRDGAQALAGLRGRFSLVAWDGEALWALRDPLGVRPMFWAQAGAAVIASPFANALLRRPGVDSSVDRLFVAGHMLLGLRALPEETPFAAVRRVPAGHVLRAGAEGVQVRRHWRPVPRETPPEERAERFGRLLEQAVARCTGGQPAAVLLSGGLDSGTLAAAASRIARRDGIQPPHALCFLNPTPEADESPTQHRVAATLGMRLIAGGPDDLVPRGEMAGAAVRLGEGQPFPAGLIQPAYDAMIRRAAAEGARSALLGDGGDEWLMPFSSWATGRILRLDLPALRLMLRAWSYAYPHDEAPHLTRDVLWRWGARALLRSVAAHAAARVWPDRYLQVRAQRLERRLPPWLAPDPALRRELLEWAVARAPEPPLTRLHEAAKDEVLVGIHTAAAMEEAHAVSRRLGVEALRPFWDVDLVEFLLGVPAEALIEGGRAKALARDYVRPDLPFADAWPAKTYGDSVVAHLLGDAEPALWRGIGTNLSAMGLAEPGLLANAIEDVRKNGRHADVMRVWAMLSVDAWLGNRV